MRESLTPGMDENVILGMRQADEVLKEMESQAYKNVFENSGDVSSGLANRLLSVYQRYPEAASQAQTLYGRRQLVPLLTTGDNGAITFARMPNLEDAEIAYRMIRDLSGKEFREGAGTMGAAVGDDVAALKFAIDDFSPEQRGF